MIVSFLFKGKIMNYRNYLEEAVKDVDPKLRQIFNKTLMQIFSLQYLKKISKNIKDYFLIKEVDDDTEIMAYNVGNKIFINRKVFYSQSMEAQARILLHEFIHLLQRKGSFFARFPELRKLTKELQDAISKHSNQPLSVFLTGKNQNLGPGKQWEILAYFMNNTIEWKALTEEGVKEVVSIIKSYEIFNTETNFWKKRLPY